MASYPALIQKQPHQIVSWKTSEEKNSRAVGANSLVSNRSDIPLFKNPAVRQVLVGGERMFPNVMKYFYENIAKSWPRQVEGYENISPSRNTKAYSIRYYNETTPTLTLCVSGNRFCLNVNRRHKRNNIMFVININNFCFTQKCHDDMCSASRSSIISLPPEIFFSTRIERENISL